MIDSWFFVVFTAGSERGQAPAQAVAGEKVYIRAHALFTAFNAKEKQNGRAGPLPLQISTLGQSHASHVEATRHAAPRRDAGAVLWPYCWSPRVRVSQPCASDGDK